MMERWKPWAVDCLRLLDADGAFARYRHGQNLNQEPAIDMAILDLVRAEWNRLRTKDLERPGGKHGR